MHALLLPIPLTDYDSTAHTDSGNFDAYTKALLPALGQLDYTTYGNHGGSEELFEEDCKALRELDDIVERLGLSSTSRSGGTVEGTESGVDSNIKEPNIRNGLTDEEEDEASEELIRKLCELLERFASLWTLESGTEVDHRDDGQGNSADRTQTSTSPYPSHTSEEPKHKHTHRRDALGYELCRRLGSWGVGDCGSELPSKQDVPLWEHLWRYTSCWSRLARTTRLPGQTEIEDKQVEIECMGDPLKTLWLGEFCWLLFRWRKKGMGWKLDMERSRVEQEQRMRREDDRAYGRAARREKAARLLQMAQEGSGVGDVTGSESGLVLPIRVLPTDYDSDEDDDDNDNDNDDESVHEQQQLPYGDLMKTSAIAGTTAKPEPPTYGPTPTFDETWFHVSIEGWQRRVAEWQGPRGG